MFFWRTVFCGDALREAAGENRYRLASLPPFGKRGSPNNWPTFNPLCETFRSLTR